MRNNIRFDATADEQQTTAVTTLSTAFLFQAGEIYDLKTVDPDSLVARINYTWGGSPVGTAVLMVVQGSNDPSMTSDVHILAERTIGDPSVIASIVGFTPSNYTIDGIYAVPFSNVLSYNLISGQRVTSTFRYVRVVVNSLGAGGSFTVTYQKD